MTDTKSANKKPPLQQRIHQAPPKSRLQNSKMISNSYSQHNHNYYASSSLHQNQYHYNSNGNSYHHHSSSSSSQSTSSSSTSSMMSNGGNSQVHNRQYYPSIDPRQIKLRKALIELAPPIVTSRSWAIVNGKTGKLMFGKWENQRREFASLTKIMTMHVVLQFSKRKNFDLKQLQIPISKHAAKINGTSAQLRAGDVMSCHDLLFAMMLPSGNDVALALAQFFGSLLMDESQKQAFAVQGGYGVKVKTVINQQTTTQMPPQIIKKQNSNKTLQTKSAPRMHSNQPTQNFNSMKKILDSQYDQSPYYSDDFQTLDSLEQKQQKQQSQQQNQQQALQQITTFKNRFTEPQNQFDIQLSVQRFIVQMNRTASHMGLKSTKFMNPHGLSNYLQKSNAAQVGKMTAIAMKDPTFRKVCSTKFYQCRPLNDSKYVYRWTNTHKMLDMSGYNGVKTGITPAAGPCLATSYQVKDIHLIIILLESKTMDHRWSQTSKLVNWTLSRLKRVTNIYGGGLEGSAGEKCQQVIKKLKNIQRVK